MKNFFMLQWLINGCAFYYLSMKFSTISVKYGKEPIYVTKVFWVKSNQ